MPVLGAVDAVVCHTGSLYLHLPKGKVRVSNHPPREAVALEAGFDTPIERILGAIRDLQLL